MSADISINAGWSKSVLITFLSNLVVQEATPYTNTEPTFICCIPPSLEFSVTLSTYRTRRNISGVKYWQIVVMSPKLTQPKFCLFNYSV